jgi:hypothetical protein
MPAPKVYKTDFVPGLTRHDLHEMAVAYAVAEFERKGAAPCMWIICTGPDVIWIETPWEDDREKVVSTAAIRAAMKAMGARSYSFITEAWMASYFDGDDTTVPPSEKEKRDDVLLISTYDQKGEFDGTRFLVTVRKHGLSYLGPRDDETMMEYKVEGRMFNLLVT